MLSEALKDLFKHLVGAASPSVYLSTKPTQIKEAQVSPDHRTQVILILCFQCLHFSWWGISISHDIAQAGIVHGIRIETHDQSSMVREVPRTLIVVLLVRLWSPTWHHSSDTVSW